MIKLLLVCATPIVRAGIKLIFQEELDMVVVGETGDVEGVINDANLSAPDVIIVDVDLLGSSRMKLIKRIVEAVPNGAVLALTARENFELLFHAVEEGAAGYVSTSNQASALIAAVRTVHNKEPFRATWGNSEGM